MINWGLARQWTLLAAVSAMLSLAFRQAGFPAAWMLGPMLAGVVFGLRGFAPRVSSFGFDAAQAVVGCMVARTISPATLGAMAQDWLVILGVTSLTILSGGLVGLLLSRFGSLPGNTAAWGASPGGATAMTAVSEAYGADVRLVAFMQYLRVFIVVLTASAVSRVLLGHSAPSQAVPALSLGFDAPVLPLLETLAIILSGLSLNLWLRIPAGALLIPMLAGAGLNAAGVVELTLPAWLLILAYAFLGWYIGLRFTRQTVLYALRALPQLLLGTFLLIGLCCGSAWLLTRLLEVDGLTAYLSTSPGGLDSVVIIAVGSGCDVPFVLALQTVRLFSVILTGPLVARLVCRLSDNWRAS